MKAMLTRTLFLLMCCSAGCGSKAAQYVPVEGVIRVDGKPAADLSVQFNPIETGGNKIKGSTGVSDVNGHFVLMVSPDVAGAVVGKHKVTVWDNRLTEDEGTRPGSRPPKPNRVPTRYLDAKNTPIEIEVNASTREYTVEVSSK